MHIYFPFSQKITKAHFTRGGSGSLGSSGSEIMRDDSALILTLPDSHSASDISWESVRELVAKRIVTIGRAEGLTVAAAESCTGGGISRDLTEIPGSSSVFLGSVVSYHNDVKSRLLGVSPRVLNNYGAVSAECCGEMAKGVLRRIPADIAVAVTGIAGPGGGSDEKPVGLVYIATAGNSERSGINGEPEIIRWEFDGDRRQVRSFAGTAALMQILMSMSGA